ncbi:chaperone modulator CbpM [Algoriphagus halophilus]|uniref:MerR HTH family regulatory protein n=1 Tax=Algoriphagus halophilus TaxID=226505 RepID=A0A1N6DNM6_9BACT|nr:chaperone modulator CbpM [Algoriphagus halophilus]SIN72385.1 MerR HTH family regulatory protein [Algoriphagus halophilus]
MVETHLIAIKTICLNYGIDNSFVEELNEFGLIHIEFIQNDKFIHQDQISDLEKMIRLRNELNLNLEGIDVVFNLLQKEKELKEELTILKNRLKLYE